MKRSLSIAAEVLILAVVVWPCGARLAAQEPPAEEAVAAESELIPEETPERTRSRRPPRVDNSNTGYIDNAVVGTQFRLRVDSASGADTPDRAEFLYGKCICWDQVDGQRTADGPGVALDMDHQELSIMAEYAIRARWSVFAELPLRRMDLFFLDFEIDPVFGAENNETFQLGLADILVGFKRAILVDSSHYLTFRFAAYLPTGDNRRGRGTGHASVEPTLLYLRRLGERWTLESQLGLWIPLSGSPDPVSGRELDGNPDDAVPYRSFKTGVGTPDPIDNDDFAGEIIRFGIGLSYDAAPGASFRPTPVIEVVGWNMLGGFVTVPDFPFFEDVSGDTILNLKAGLRLRSRRTRSWYLGYGFALTDDVWYDSIVRIEYRSSF